MTGFEEATHVAPGTLKLFLAGTVAMASLLWLSWISFENYKAWQTGDKTFYEFISRVVRGAIIVLLIGFFVRP